MSLHCYLRPIDAALKKAGSTAEAKCMSKYLRDKFEFYGVRAPKCKEILKIHVSENRLPKDMAELDKVIRSGWTHPKREMQYIAMYLLDKSYKLWDADCMEDLLQHLI